MIENNYINCFTRNNSFTLINLAPFLSLDFPAKASSKTKTGKEGSKIKNYLKIAAKQHYPHFYSWTLRKCSNALLFQEYLSIKKF